jgi:hypothetical protein
LTATADGKPESATTRFSVVVPTNPQDSCNGGDVGPCGDYELSGKIRAVYDSRICGCANTGNADATSPYGTKGQYAGFATCQILWPISGPGGTDQAYTLWGELLCVYRRVGGVTGTFGWPNTGQSDAVSP